MEKRSTLLLTVIAIATLLVAVVGATFAYFAGTVNNSNTVNATVTTGAANLVLTSIGGDITLEVDAANMTNATVNHVFTSTNKNLTVKLEGGDSNTSCTYDVYYKWTTTYTKTTSAEKELTLKVGTLMSEAQVVDSTAGATKINTDAEKITSGNTKDYEVEVKFYNLALNQSAHAEKTYTLDVYVANVVC